MKGTSVTNELTKYTNTYTIARFLIHSKQENVTISYIQNIFSQIRKFSTETSNDVFSKKVFRRSNLM